MDRPQQMFLNPVNWSLTHGFHKGVFYSPFCSKGREGMCLFQYADDMALVAHMDNMEVIIQYQLAVDDVARNLLN